MCDLWFANPVGVHSQKKTIQRQHGSFGIWHQQKCLKSGWQKAGRTPVWNNPQVNSSHVEVRTCWGSRDCMKDITKWARGKKRRDCNLFLHSGQTFWKCKLQCFWALDALGLKVRICDFPVLHWFSHSFLQNVIWESLSFIEARCYITGMPP